jgi:LPXTG-motif cell wall-anchored protein
MDDDYRDEHQGDDPAAAFERLRGEVSLLRSAIEGLTAARETIDIPDYEPTLARTEKVLTVLAEQFSLLRQSPAMTLTPEIMGARLNAAVADSVNTLRSHSQASKSALDCTVNELRGIVRSARTGDDQNRWLLWTGLGGLALGLVLYALLAGPIARLMPASWQWPERMATRVLAERIPWDAGQHLMSSASRPSWEAVVAADTMLRDNRETIDGCRAAAGKAKKAVRCTVEVKPAPISSDR